MSTKTKYFKYIILANISLLIYSSASLLMKQSSNYKLFSIGFFLIYLGALSCLVLFSFLWQQVLKKLPLTIAFSNKAIVIIWGFILGNIIFGEHITINMIIGAIIIILGVCLVVYKSE